MFTDKIKSIGLTFDDVLLVPRYSDFIPRDADTISNLTRNIQLNIPIVSSPMDTVTETEMAIAIARQGGIGIIHRNQDIDNQSKMVERVKRSESAVIVDPITLDPDETLSDALSKTKKYNISGLPVVKGLKLLGILTNRDMRFEKDSLKKVSSLMTSKNLVTAPIGTSLDKAKEIMAGRKVEKLLLVDDSFNLKGLITIKDINSVLQFPDSCKDKFGRLRVGAAIGVSENDKERVERLISKHVDVIVVDTAHGHSKSVIEMVQYIRKEYPEIDIIAGNVATREATEALINAGVDAVKVGIGPGSICTTRIIAGVGVPQISAIMECAEVAYKNGISIIADGGIKYSGDIPKALVAGANSVMIGGLFAGTTESPGEIILYQGRTYKTYRGMGSIGAMSKGSKDRYFQADITEREKLVPEGIEGMVAFKGLVKEVIYQLVGGLKSSMGYLGCKNIKELQENSKFITITPASVRESHPHDVIITKEAPNYQKIDVSV